VCVCVCVRVCVCVSVPVVVPVAQRPDGDLEGLPHGVQVVLHHLRFVADGEPERETHAVSTLAR